MSWVLIPSTSPTPDFSQLSSMPSLTLSCVSTPSKSLAYSNCIYVSDATFASLVRPEDSEVETSAYGVPVALRGYIFSVRPAPGVEDDQVALNMLQRRATNASLGEGLLMARHTVRVSDSLAEATLEVASLMKRSEALSIDAKELADVIKARFLRQYLTVGQSIAMEMGGRVLSLKVTMLSRAALGSKAAVDDGEGGAAEGKAEEAGGSGSGRGEDDVGQLMKFTTLSLVKAGGSSIKLTGQSSSATAAKIFRPDFNFEKLGIGGLDEEFSQIFRRAFASRVFPPDLIAKMGIPHVRGMLLYGPPGCGKTLIARQIGKMLNAREPKIISGPEVMSKFVGETEKNLRELFEDAEAEYKEAGDESELHIIIFDEIDAICKARGSTRDGTGVHDSMVNQLLSKIDGVDALNNILVIGMTNRKDMIDSALLRPGRLEVHVEIGLPDESGRMQILRIKTAGMRDHGMLAKDVSLPVLAAETKNFSGAEIEGLCKSASSFAMQRHVDGSDLGSIADVRDLRIEMADFTRALEEVTPAFGVSEEELLIHIRNGIIDHGERFKSLTSTLHDLVEQSRTSARTPLLSVLLHGESGCGKTALAAHVAKESQFPYVRLLQADEFIGMGDMSKCTKLAQIFEDAYKSPLSMIILDDLERLLSYIPIGPHFNNAVLQALLILVRKVPPPGCSLFVIATTSRARHMEELGLTDVFDAKAHVPMLRTPAEVAAVLTDVGGLTAEAVEAISQSFDEGRSSISIKRLLMVLEMARQDGEPTVERFNDCLMNFGGY
eukprot:PLAT10437.1.p1 GENE.PLAT10437.1~~PLAT10437.1.p1  ORF type:complete len:778 (-),score=439.15 PLAT10437.1:290-2623(-)